MGTLILPSAGSVYVDANTVIYAVEKIEPYKTFHNPDALHAATGLSVGCTLFLSSDSVFTRVPGLPVTTLSTAIAA